MRPGRRGTDRVGAEKEKAERRPVRGSDPEGVGWGAGAQQREGKEHPLSTHYTQISLRVPLLRPAWQPA